jgi:uncharacterized protein YlxW (UPF0749 family)
VTAEPTSLAPTRRDPSLALLESLIADALDPGYAAAAERQAQRTDVPSPNPRRTARVSSLVSVVIVALVLTIAVEQVRASAPSVSKRRDALVDRVDAAGRDVSTLEQRVRTTTTDVDRLRRAALGSTANAGPADGLDRLSQLAGLTAVMGPGVIVTVDDAAAASPDAANGGTDEGDDLGQVLDVDLQEVVNGLWEAGAQAVSINGHRITALSAIRGAGAAVLVDYRPLARPYVVSAIGPATLAHAFKSGHAGDDLEDLHSGYGIRFDVEQQGEVTVPAATSLTLRSVKGAG